jgi:LysM repeat protein
MKRVSLYAAVVLILLSAPAWAQDAATQERLDKMAGQIQDFLDNQKSLQQQLSQVSKEVSALREQIANQPREDWATAADLKRLADGVREIDKKRIEDNERIRTEISKLGKLLASAPAPRSRPARDEEPKEKEPAKPEAGLEYVVQPGDSLSLIVQACREKGIKVTMDQVRKANPKLNPEKLLVGQKIFIPQP